MIVYLVLVGGPVLGILLCLWKAWDFARWWRPADAVTLSNDYDEAERVDDQAPLASLRPSRMLETNGARRTVCHVRYRDLSGTDHQADIIRYVYRGKRPPSAMTILYDSREPNRAAYRGASGQLFNVVFYGMLLATAINVLSSWRGPLI